MLVTTSDDAILAAIKTLSDKIDDVRAEQRVQNLETRTGFAEVRGSIAELRNDVTTRLTTLFDELAAFRREYNEHGHPDS